ncbi:Cupredoxin, partial [Zychaea mexicana]|uniref:Cupredoxin n=1 Tax=Zychaea mexicana TaxID=64656 RepID=UPI0022FDB85C
ANAAVRRFELDITADFANPDCHQAPYPALRVNGQFPAPTLRVVKGDDVEVVVHNSAYALNVSTTVHFHGIRQYGTVESDGVPDVTQAAIPPGQSFTHRFRVIDQIGTYFYHAHQGMQDDTVQGALIVHDDERSMPPEDHADCGLVEGPYLYYGERTLQLSEWWHQSFVDREEYYMSKHFIYDKGADSILLNGRTVHQDNHNSSLEMSTKNVCPGYSAINVEPNQTYRLRIIGAHTFRTLGVAIEQHNMTVIEADGELTKPYEVDWLEIGPGQRFSVLIHTGDMKAGDENVFPIATSYRWRHRPSGGHTENGFAYLRYTNNLKQEDETLYKPVLPGRNGKELAESMHYPSYTLADGLPVFPNENILDWFWPEIAPLDDSTGTTLLNAQADRVIKLRSTSVKRPNNETRYLMNDRAPISRQRPVLTDVLERHIHTDMVDKENDGFSLDLHTFPIKMGEVVDIVLQNTKAGRNCLIHPWHTHGHSHYMIASGPGEYVHETHADVRNYPTPLFRDVSMVYPTDTEESGGCGWSKIRIYADNPGVWALHCHITSHMMQGKFAVLE